MLVTDGMEGASDVDLFLVRHGDALGVDGAGNATPDGALSLLGERQARLVGARLAGAGVTRILSSPLVRALATASHIAEACRHRSVEVWPELREGYSETHHGYGRADLAARFPLSVLPAGVAGDGWDHGGDTPVSLTGRAARIATLLAARCAPDDRAIVVSHGGIVNYLLHVLLGVPSSAPVWFEMDNGAITALRLVPEPERRDWPLYPPVAVELLTLNDVAHLAEAARLPKSSRQ